jgi:Rad3-related DNA helicase
VVFIDGCNDMLDDTNIYRSKEQREFSNRISEHLRAGGSPLLLEGAAGLGKTRAYLVPLLASGQPVAICVPTRALASQLLGSADWAAVRAQQTIVVFTPRREFDTQAQYLAHKQACRGADVLVCTHQAALIDVLADGALLGLQDRFAVLFDEADQLPDAAALRFDCSINAFTLAVLGIKPEARNHRKTVAAVLSRLPVKRELLDEPAEVQAACRGIADALDEPVWYHSVGLTQDGDLQLVHKLPARALKRLLSHPRLMFISATLSVNGLFTDFKRALGLTEENMLSGIVEPARHGTLDVVSEPWDIGAADHMSKVAAHVATLQGASLVITVSHQDAQTLGALIPDATLRDIDPLTGARESAGQAAARMLANGSQVLVAAGAWAGLDTTVRWRHVVMPKAPYGKPTELDGHTVSSYVESKNIAIRRFRQGLARGLRTTESVCTLHLLDSRFERDAFQKALPQRFASEYKKRYGVVELRTRQAEFRKRMLTLYNGRCAITGCTETGVLDAAHLGDKGGWRTKNENKDGVLLRTDLHRLMDAGKLSIIDGVVHIDEDSHDYQQFHGINIWADSRKTI